MGYLDFRKASDTVSHEILIDKLGKSHVAGAALRRVRNWLEKRTRSVVINGPQARWKGRTGGVSRGLLWDRLWSISASAT